MRARASPSAPAHRALRRWASRWTCALRQPAPARTPCSTAPMAHGWTLRVSRPMRLPCSTASRRTCPRTTHWPVRHRPVSASSRSLGTRQPTQHLRVPPMARGALRVWTTSCCGRCPARRRRLRRRAPSQLLPAPRLRRALTVLAPASTLTSAPLTRWSGTCRQTAVSTALMARAWTGCRAWRGSASRASRWPCRAATPRTRVRAAILLRVTCKQTQAAFGSAPSPLSLRSATRPTAGRRPSTPRPASRPCSCIRPSTTRSPSASTAVSPTRCTTATGTTTHSGARTSPSPQASSRAPFTSSRRCGHRPT